MCFKKNYRVIYSKILPLIGYKYRQEKSCILKHRIFFTIAGLPIKALSEKAQAVVVCFSPPTDGYVRQKVTIKYLA